MEIKEWHIALQQELNKINSALYDVLLPQEIDLAFNKNIMMFVNQRYSSKSNRKQEGFEQSQKRIDDLKSLVKVKKDVALRGISFTPYLSPEERTVFILPDNYLYKVATRLQTSTKGCSTSFIPQTEEVTYYIYGFNLAGITNYSSFYIKNPDGVKVFTENSGLGAYTTDDYGIFKNIVLDECNAFYKTTNTVFYENFFSYTKKNHLLFVTTTPGTFKYYNGSAEVNLTLLSTIVDSKYPTQGTVIVTSDKQVTHDTVYALQADPFNETTEDFPLSFFENDLYYTLNETNKFVVSNVEMTYICKPRTVSYYGNISCDLPEHTHQEIISMTAQYFLEEFEAGRQQTHKETVLTTE